MVTAQEVSVQQFEILFYQSNLDPMTLIPKLNLYIVKMSHHTKNVKAFKSYSPNGYAGRHKIHKEYEDITFLRMWEVKIEITVSFY